MTSQVVVTVQFIKMPLDGTIVEFAINLFPNAGAQGISTGEQVTAKQGDRAVGRSSSSSGGCGGRGSSGTLAGSHRRIGLIRSDLTLALDISIRATLGPSATRWKLCGDGRYIINGIDSSIHPPHPCISTLIIPAKKMSLVLCFAN